MTFYVKIENGPYRSYAGLTQEVIHNLLTAEGVTYNFITQAEFEAGIN